MCNWYEFFRRKNSIQKGRSRKKIGYMKCFSSLISYHNLQRIETDGFTCTEMQDGRQWSYQTDIFCIAGTIHVMLFGEYMQSIKKFGQWDIKSKLPR